MALKVIIILAIIIVLDIIITIVVMRLTGNGYKNPNKSPQEVHTGKLLDKYLKTQSMGGKGYPCLEIDIGKKRPLRVFCIWEYFDNVYPGDVLTVSHRAWLVDDLTVDVQGEESKEKLTRHTVYAKLVDTRTEKEAKARELFLCLFETFDGEKLTLRAPEGYQAPYKGIQGELVYHDTFLDAFEPFAANNFDDDDTDAALAETPAEPADEAPEEA